MSKATKRKHVVKEVLRDEMRGLDDGQKVVCVLEGRGNNLHLVEDPLMGEEYLVSMPTKFRRNVWVKRGDHVIVDPIPEGGKVRAEISRILDRKYISFLRDLGQWPSAFDSTPECDLNDEGLFVNNNRQDIVGEEEATSSSDED